MNTAVSSLTAELYRHILKPFFFRNDAERVHERMTAVGEWLGKKPLLKKTMSTAYAYTNPRLEQTIERIHFKTPLGLSAGFDYEARLTDITPAIGFGFETVGTITNNAYGGNPKPRLGRLPRSRSLMVNKGFKNPGAAAIIAHLEPKIFQLPIGISIGRTNSTDLSQRESVMDIVRAFRLFETSTVRHSYYELNISCPNLYGTVSFYTPRELHELLLEVDGLRLTRPVFIKMPIEKSDKETREMLEVIAEHTPVGVIFGNLQKDRTHPALQVDEVSRFPVGNFSGKATFDRSNQLIGLTYQHYHQRFTIIGSGGVFSAEDAYMKITQGASLVQLITGMIFQGPQLIGQINQGLVKLLDEHHFSTISDAVGSAHKH